MNLKLDETGLRVRLSPSELEVLLRSFSVSTCFPLGGGSALGCKLRIGSKLALEMSGAEISLEIPEEMMRRLKLGVASGKKAEHEITAPYQGTIVSLGVDFFQARKEARP